MHSSGSWPVGPEEASAACSDAALGRHPWPSLGRHPWPSLGLQFFLIIGPRNTREESDRLEHLGVVVAPCCTHESGRQAWCAGPNRSRRLPRPIIEKNLWHLAGRRPDRPALLPASR